MERDPELCAVVDDTLRAKWTGKRFSHGAIKEVFARAVQVFDKERVGNASRISRYARRLALTLEMESLRAERERREQRIEALRAATSRAQAELERTPPPTLEALQARLDTVRAKHRTTTPASEN